VSPELLSAVRKDLNKTTYKRALHVVNEIERVKQACKALASNDLMSLGLLMYRSHEDLSKNYEVSCPELDFLVDQARLNSDILGARMMGGGFGGCTINLIRNSGIEAFVSRTQLNYQRKFGFRPEVYIVHSGSGAGLI
jgi:galactokinase